MNMISTPSTSMREPRVTVVIPTYNTARYLSAAIQSVLDQTYKDFEVIVVDDGSTDNTRELLAEIRDPRLRVICTENRGVAAARNTGWRLGKGEYIAFLDADDVWSPHKLAVQVAYLDSHCDVGLVGALMYYCDERGRIFGRTGVLLDHDNDLERIRTARLMPFPISSVMCRRSLLEDIGGFDEELRKIVGQVEDLDFMARAARRSLIACIPEKLGCYRLHSGSASARHFFSQRIGTRFVRERLKADQQGQSLTWEDFRDQYRVALREWLDDWAAYSFRVAGLNWTMGKWFSAGCWMLMSLLSNPVYALKRLLEKRPWEKG